MSEDTNKVRIVKAVEAIVEAASLEVDTLTKKTLCTNLDELKSSFDNKLEAVSQSMKVSNEYFDSKINTMNQHKVSIDNKLEAISQSMKVSNENFDVKINTMNQHIITLEENMKEVQGFLAAQDKRQKLEFAISCSNLQEFKYKSEDSQKMSSTLVEKILRWFALGYGYHLPSDATAYSSSKSEKTKEEVFRAKLMKQLENLIGHKPRLVENEKGDFTIFYE